jgi:aminoglycoside/choline kinase family phosphotransferase
MQLPKGLASVSEEITNFKGNHEELPFLNVAKYLKQKGINVPAVHHYSREDDLLILEDLGDELLARKVETENADILKHWYEKAIDLLITLQAKTANSDKKECVALQRSFDEFLFNWEFDHFLEYGVETRLDKKIAEQDKQIIVEYLHKLAREIVRLPYGFTHRDYQSRNIFVVDDELFLIDFQDALLGPQAYDLVSLLRDSYVELSPQLVSQLVDYYCTQKSIETKSFQREFDLVTIQRKLKDSGRFVYIDRVKNNPGYLKYIPSSLRYVKEALKRLPEYKELYSILKSYVPEWNN